MNVVTISTEKIIFKSAKSNEQYSSMHIWFEVYS